MFHRIWGWLFLCCTFCFCSIATAAVTSQSDHSSHSDLQPKLPVSEEIPMPKVAGADTPMSFAGICLFVYLYVHLYWCTVMQTGGLIQLLYVFTQIYMQGHSFGGRALVFVWPYLWAFLWYMYVLSANVLAKLCRMVWAFAVPIWIKLPFLHFICCSRATI